MRPYLFSVACVALSQVSAQDGWTRLSDQEAAKFWSIPHSSMTWSEFKGPDFDVYEGHAKSPLHGGAGIYMGEFPDFHPPAENPGISGRLGGYDVRWFESRQKDGLLRKETLLRVRPSEKCHVWIYGSSRSDIAALEKELSTYHLFSPRPASPPLKGSNQAMQPTAGRRTLKFPMTQTSSPAETRPLASGADLVLVRSLRPP